MSAARKRTGSRNGSTTAEDVDGATKIVNRRALLRNAGLAAGGGAAVALTGMGAKHASASNGNPVILGASNSATSETSVVTTSGDGLFGRTSDSTAAGVYGVDGSGTGGVGVYGYSFYGVGVTAASLTSSQLSLVPGNQAGPPMSGAHAAGEIYVDGSLAMWLCTVGGTGGTWRPIVVGGLTNNVGAAQTVLNASVQGIAALNVVNAISSNPQRLASMRRLADRAGSRPPPL